MIDIKKKNNSKYVILFFLILIFSTTFFIMYKYYVEGEKNIPFNITELMVISSAKTQNFEKYEEIYQADIIQKNDIYIAIEKNENYKKQDSIKKITINNFKILEQGEKGNIRFYRTAINSNDFEYVEAYEINEKVEFTGASQTNINTENMTIANQGGLIKLSVIIDNLGKIEYLENDDIASDGSLLNRLQLTSEKIKAKISFDMSIELSGGNTFKTTITVEIPSGDIVKEGVCTNEIDVSKIVYKRI